MHQYVSSKLLGSMAVACVSLLLVLCRLKYTHKPVPEKGKGVGAATLIRRPTSAGEQPGAVRSHRDHHAGYEVGVPQETGTQDPLALPLQALVAVPMVQGIAGSAGQAAQRRAHSTQHKHCMQHCIDSETWLYSQMGTLHGISITWHGISITWHGISIIWHGISII